MHNSIQTLTVAPSSIDGWFVNASLKGLRLLLTLTALQSMVFAAAITINGNCELGNCTSPDVLQPGQSTGMVFNFVYEFADTDVYRIFGGYSAFESRTGYSISFGQNLTAVYLGNGTGTASETDVLTTDLLQNYNVAFSSGTFHESINTHLYGPLATSSSASGQLILDGQALPLMGPFPSPGNYAAGFANIHLSGLSNPLLSDFRYVYTFEAGSDPGATIGSLTPEPNSLLLAALGLFATAMAAVKLSVRHHNSLSWHRNSGARR